MNIKPTDPSDPRNHGRHLRLWGEFGVLFVAIPVLMAALKQAGALWTVMGAMSVAGVVLFALTPGVRWKALAEGGILRHWRFVLLFTAVTCALTIGLVQWLTPWRFLQLPLEAPALWVRIMALYPILSALPQELVFRALFFERYGGLFPNTRISLFVNAAVFALAHLFYANWIALSLTFFGGLAFAWAYARMRSFPLAFILHALGGQIVFTSGLGWFFYHGAVGTS